MTLSERTAKIRIMIQKRNELERLVVECEEAHFEHVHGLVAAFVDECVENAPPNLIFDERKKAALTRGIYSGIKFYKGVDDRKVIGKYSAHPIRVMKRLIEAGCDDLRTLLTGIEHDILEEWLKEARKTNLYFNEKRFYQQHIPLLKSTISLDLRIAGYSLSTARRVAEDTAFTVLHLTKRDGEKYNEYAHRIYAPLTYRELDPVLQVRAMRVKAADATDNNSELYHPEALQQRVDKITMDRVIRAYESQNTRERRRLEREAAELSKPYNHPHAEDERLELRGPAWIKALYKGTVILLSYRDWCIETRKRDYVIEHLGLAQEIIAKTEEIINHNLTYHCRNGVTLKTYYDKYRSSQNYFKRGGYHIRTPVGSDENDGIIDRCDGSVRKVNNFIESLEEDRQTMQLVAFGLGTLAELVLQNPEYRFPIRTHSALTA